MQVEPKHKTKLYYSVAFELYTQVPRKSCHIFFLKNKVAFSKTDFGYMRKTTWQNSILKKK